MCINIYIYYIHTYIHKATTRTEHHICPPLAKLNQGPAEACDFGFSSPSGAFWNQITNKMDKYIPVELATIHENSLAYINLLGEEYVYIYIYMKSKISLRRIFINNRLELKPPKCELSSY